MERVTDDELSVYSYIPGERGAENPSDKPMGSERGRWITDEGQRKMVSNGGKIRRAN